MFNWLKKLFGKTDKQVDPAFPFPKAKEVDQSHMAPYKVEAPANDTVVAAEKTVEDKPAKKAPATKKPRAPKKKTSTGGAQTGQQRRGRKPKAKPVQ